MRSQLNRYQFNNKLIRGSITSDYDIQRRVGAALKNEMTVTIFNLSKDVNAILPALEDIDGELTENSATSRVSTTTSERRFGNDNGFFFSSILQRVYRVMIGMCLTAASYTFIIGLSSTTKQVRACDDNKKGVLQPDKDMRQ